MSKEAKSKYWFNIEHIDHEGERFVYTIHCVSLTRREVQDAVDDALEGEDPISEMAFRNLKRDGEPIDLDDLPLEVLTGALERHPSFRERGVGGGRRRRR